MTYKEELNKERIKYEQERMLDTLENDAEFVNNICKGIGSVFRREYVENQKDSVTFCLISRNILDTHDLYPSDLVKHGRVVDYKENHFVRMTMDYYCNFIPCYLMLEIRYQLAKEYGLVFVQDIARESIKVKSLATGNLVTISFNKITLKLK